MTENGAAGDLPAASLHTVPRSLSATRWRRWRAQNPPPWLRAEYRHGTHCGYCGEPLTPVTRLCVACYEADRP